MEDSALIWALINQNTALIEQNGQCLAMVNRMLNERKVSLLDIPAEPDEPSLISYPSTEFNEQEAGEFVEGEVYLDVDLIAEVQKEMDDDDLSEG